MVKDQVSITMKFVQEQRCDERFTITIKTPLPEIYPNIKRIRLIENLFSQ